jgi:hypothetical protein
MSYTVNTLQDWKNRFGSQSVQNNNGTFGADFLSSESTVMFAGPASYPATGGLENFIPIGLVQNVQISQQKQIQQLYEIGSRKPMFIPGRTVTSGGVSRILFDGPSLMYAMYLRGQKGEDNATSAFMSPEGTPWSPLGSGSTVGSWYSDVPAEMHGAVTLGGDTIPGEFKNENNDKDTPRPGYFFINLASSFFNRPTGIGFVLYDMEGNPYGGMYLENCYIQAHTFSVASQQTVLVENVSFRASSVKTMDILP